uniref:Protein RFT1 homolog n=1 Tax=Alexandrium monilatum TaxID=311494 RepID=A0A7S4SFZ1_9DINO
MATARRFFLAFLPFAILFGGSQALPCAPERSAQLALGLCSGALLAAALCCCRQADDLERLASAGLEGSTPLPPARVAASLGLVALTLAWPSAEGKLAPTRAITSLPAFASVAIAVSMTSCPEGISGSWAGPTVPSDFWPAALVLAGDALLLPLAAWACHHDTRQVRETWWPEWSRWSPPGSSLGQRLKHFRHAVSSWRGAHGLGAVTSAATGVTFLKKMVERGFHGPESGLPVMVVAWSSVSLASHLLSLLTDCRAWRALVWARDQHFRFATVCNTNLLLLKLAFQAFPVLTPVLVPMWNCYADEPAASIQCDGTTLLSADHCFCQAPTQMTHIVTVLVVLSAATVVRFKVSALREAFRLGARGRNRRAQLALVSWFVHVACNVSIMGALVAATTVRAHARFDKWQAEVDLGVLQLLALPQLMSELLANECACLLCFWGAEALKQEADRSALSNTKAIQLLQFPCLVTCAGVGLVLLLSPDSACAYGSPAVSFALGALYLTAALATPLLPNDAMAYGSLADLGARADHEMELSSEPRRSGSAHI